MKSTEKIRIFVRNFSSRRGGLLSLNLKSEKCSLKRGGGLLSRGFLLSNIRYTIINSCSEVSNCVGLYSSESIFKMIWQSYSHFQRIIFGCSEGKPKNCIKIQNPKFQFLDPKFFQNLYTLRKWPKVWVFDP